MGGFCLYQERKDSGASEQDVCTLYGGKIARRHKKQRGRSGIVERERAHGKKRQDSQKEQDNAALLEIFAE